MAHHNYVQVREKLKLLRSPVAPERCNTEEDDKDNHFIMDPEQETVESSCPDFQRYEEPTVLEIFYDLFFAANYNVFSENQDATDHARFKAYVGYFSLLWLTWFVTTAYDVRFLSDSIFERGARVLHLGVLVGFAIITPNFDPNNQEVTTMKATSLILMSSRAVLAIEYAVTLWQVRNFNKSCRRPFYVMIAANVVAMLIYLGISFRFTGHRNSRVYMAWYFVSGAEGVLTLVLSNLSPLLSFNKTHIMKRLFFLTIMMLGDGLVNIAKEVVVIVRNPHAWDALTIGQVTGGVATVYLIFLIYYDWLRGSFYLPKLRQQIWVFLHMPFHAALVLFMQAFTQYIIWSKAVDGISKISGSFDNDNVVELANATSADVSDLVQNVTERFFSDYAPKVAGTLDTVHMAVQNLTTIPNSFWPLAAAYAETANDTLFNGSSQEIREALATFYECVDAVTTAMANNLFANFGIDLKTNIKSNGSQGSGNITSTAFQNQVSYTTWRQYRLAFARGYIAGGCCLFFMCLLAIAARTTPWKAWPIVRLVILILIAFGTGLVSLLWFSKPTHPDVSDEGDLCLAFLYSPWVLPTLTFVYSAVLVITHIGGQPQHSSSRPDQKIFQIGKKGSYDIMLVPLARSVH